MTEAPSRAVDPRLLVVGDSVLQSLEVDGVADRYLAASGWEVTIDAVVGRYPGPSIDALQSHLDEVGDIVIVQLGNNYDGNQDAFRADVERALSMVSGVPEVDLLTVSEFRAQQQEVNEVLREAAERYPNVRLLDWASVTAENRSFLRPDRLHLTQRGSEALGRFIAAAVGDPARPLDEPPPVPDGVPPDTTSG